MADRGGVGQMYPRTERGCVYEKHGGVDVPTSSKN